MFRIDKPFAQANIPKTVRFTDRINTSLIEISKAEGISFNELVLRCCQYAIEHYHAEDEVKSENEKEFTAKE